MSSTLSLLSSKEMTMGLSSRGTWSVAIGVERLQAVIIKEWKASRIDDCVPERISSVALPSGVL